MTGIIDHRVPPADPGAWAPRTFDSPGGSPARSQRRRSMWRNGRGNSPRYWAFVDCTERTPSPDGRGPGGSGPAGYQRRYQCGPWFPHYGPISCRCRAGRPPFLTARPFRADRQPCSPCSASWSWAQCWPQWRRLSCCRPVGWSGSPASGADALQVMRWGLVLVSPGPTKLLPQAGRLSLQPPDPCPKGLDSLVVLGLVAPGGSGIDGDGSAAPTPPSCPGPVLPQTSRFVRHSPSVVRKRSSSQPNVPSTSTRCPTTSSDQPPRSGRGDPVPLPGQLWHSTHGSPSTR
jgi:hypothetical protein